MEEPVIIVTADGSHSLYVSEINETYHSAYGAMAESEFVYISNGYQFCKGIREINIFEIGFGTGLNCLLTALEAERKRILTCYYTIEKYPLSQETVKSLNYPQLTGEIGAEIFEKLHSAPWEKSVSITPWFNLKKIRDDVLTCEFSRFPSFNLVYFDAFSPEKQPEMWNPELFGRLFEKMRSGAVFITYCAKGSVRRDLIRTGLEIERLPGPKGKREIMRGLKSDLMFQKK
jgi:tRNA U34 5-methylaminomethyl-2-thiouridine-forming methyltransferase MnmC